MRRVRSLRVWGRSGTGGWPPIGVTGTAVRSALFVRPAAAMVAISSCCGVSTVDSGRSSVATDCPVPRRGQVDSARAVPGHAAARLNSNVHSCPARQPRTAFSHSSRTRTTREDSCSRSTVGQVARGGRDEDLHTHTRSISVLRGAARRDTWPAVGFVFNIVSPHADEVCNERGRAIGDGRYGSGDRLDAADRGAVAGRHRAMLAVVAECGFR